MWSQKIASTMPWEMERTLSYIQKLKMLTIIVMMLFCVPLPPQFQLIGVFCPCLKKISIKKMLDSKKRLMPNINSFLIQLFDMNLLKTFNILKFLFMCFHPFNNYYMFKSAFTGIDNLSFWHVDHNLATQEYEWLDYFTNFFLWINLYLVIILIC